MEDADGRDYPITKNRKKPNLREVLVLDGQQITKSSYEQLSYRFDSCNLHKHTLIENIAEGVSIGRYFKVQQKWDVAEWKTLDYRSRMDYLRAYL